MAAATDTWRTVQTAQVWAAHGLTLGESPLYDRDHDRLFVQDIFEQQLYIFDLAKDPSAVEPRKIALADNLGVLGLIDGDSEHLIASAKRGVARISLADGAMEYLCRYNKPEDEQKYRANDGVIDPKGRLWSGTHSDFTDPTAGAGMDDTPRDGFLFRFDPDGTLHRVLEGMAAPNGMNFSTDHKTFYIIDSFYNCIFAYDFNVEDGTISNERELISFDRKLGVPDGAHIDCDDKIYVAMAFGESNVLIVDPGNRGKSDGRVIGQVDVDAQMVTCPTFGGQDMLDLYITTASVESMVPHIKESDKNCGSIFKARVETPGTRRFKFAKLQLKDELRAYRPLPKSPYTLGNLGLASMPRME